MHRMFSTIDTEPPVLVAVTVKFLAVAASTVGVPYISPLVLFRYTPTGSAGLTVYAMLAPPEVDAAESDDVSLYLWPRVHVQLT
jgi:hypothetical protein